MADNDWISQIGAIVAPLLEQFSPRSAEAKVLPRDQASADLIDAIEKGTVLPESSGITDPLLRGNFNPLKRKIYQQVMRSAQARPETVGVQYSPDVIPYADFTPATNEIRLQSDKKTGATPMPTWIAQQDILSHELLHFLMKVIPNDSTKTFSTETQHELIEYLLGSRSTKQNTEEDYQKLKPLSITPETSNIPISMLQSLLRQIFSQQPLQDKVLSGLKGR